MENQHRKIAGYRELSQAEIDLMNRIKAKGAELLELQAELVRSLKSSEVAKYNNIDNAATNDVQAEANVELARFNNAEPFRWAAIGKTDIQTGLMAMVRAVAQPAGVWIHEQDSSKPQAAERKGTDHPPQQGVCAVRQRQKVSVLQRHQPWPEPPYPSR